MLRRAFVIVQIVLGSVIAPASGADIVDFRRCVFEPMSGSKAAEVVRGSDGQDAVRLGCSFAGGRIERASWDCAIELDLTMCKGVEFDFYCAAPSPVAYFTMYFRSGGGWYSGGFEPGGAGKRQRIRISKNETGVEGRCAGWGKVDRIRISAWRGQNRDTEFYVKGMGLFGDDARILVVRAESATEKAPSEVEAVRRYAESMGRFLDDAGLSYLPISDLDIEQGRLGGVKVLVLPHNPTLPEKNAAYIRSFLKGGGKMISFYNLPKELEDAAGIMNEAFVRAGRDGEFASIRGSDAPLKGAPEIVKQDSWNIRNAVGVTNRARVAAWWYDDKGQSTGKAAIVASDNAIHMTHVLLDDDRDNKTALLLAMVGNLCPELWREAAEGRIEKIAQIGAYDKFDDAYRDILKTSDNGYETMKALNSATDLRKEALSKVATGDYSKAIDLAGKGRKAVLEAYCLAQKPLAGEHRAFWCHSAFGVSGYTWDEAIKILAENGFTAILPNMLWAGVAYYPSDVLPVSPEVAARGDQIALCLAACRKYGVECHVWKVNHNMGWATDKEFMRRMKAEGRTQVSFGGTDDDRWLCPSNPENRKLEVASMVEVVRKYDVDGIHFDYIRYPGGDSCFCNGCRERFEKAIGAKVKNWPGDVRSDDSLNAKWLDFRRGQITQTVADVAEEARKVRADVKISAAVFRNWPADRDSVGQDWKLWCDRGYLDFVCPMDYTPNNEFFERMVSSQIEWTGKVPCYPGIGLSTWSDRGDVAGVIEQIKLTQKYKTGGFTIFNYGDIEAREILPNLGKGITRKK